MKPYYEDEWVTLFNGRCEDVLPGLSISGDVHLVTDPPYFGVKAEAWDNQWGSSSEFLSWMGEWLGLAKPLLSANASVWVFASPQLTSSVERVVGEQFRVLNSVRWVKPQGWHQKADLDAARSFLSPWEGVVFAEQFHAEGFAKEPGGYDAAAQELRGHVFTPIREYLVAERDAAGVSNREVDERLGTSGMAGHYFGASQWAIPTENVYAKLRDLFNSGGGKHLAREYEDLRREYEDLRREYEDLRREFSIQERGLSGDVWTFDTVPPYPGKHPCEKPEPLLAHIIRTTTRPGDTIIDPFAGSGSTLRVARQLGRKAIGIEMDPKWCEHATRRLGQASFDLEGI